MYECMNMQRILLSISSTPCPRKKVRRKVFVVSFIKLISFRQNLLYDVLNKFATKLLNVSHLAKIVFLVSTLLWEIYKFLAYFFLGHGANPF